MFSMQEYDHLKVAGVERKTQNGTMMLTKMALRQAAHSQWYFSFFCFLLFFSFVLLLSYCLFFFLFLLVVIIMYYYYHYFFSYRHPNGLWPKRPQTCWSFALIKSLFLKGKSYLAKSQKPNEGYFGHGLTFGTFLYFLKKKYNLIKSPVIV